jgi:hypothetical protein
MKYICLGYLEPGKFEGMTEDERHAVRDQARAGTAHRPETTVARETSEHNLRDRTAHRWPLWLAPATGSEIVVMWRVGS